ncbi:hypothetical protein F4802DRAFT_598689 [Xylaria palmicola]|nr:hypothetical protein F4802DRAFT_598689 [Xylaria palmicola]
MDRAVSIAKAIDGLLSRDTSHGADPVATQPAPLDPRHRAHSDPDGQYNVFGATAIPSPQYPWAAPSPMQYTGHNYAHQPSAAWGHPYPGYTQPFSPIYGTSTAQPKPHGKSSFNPRAAVFEASMAPSTNGNHASSRRAVSEGAPGSKAPLWMNMSSPSSSVEAVASVGSRGRSRGGSTQSEFSTKLESVEEESMTGEVSEPASTEGKTGSDDGKAKIRKAPSVQEVSKPQPSAPDNVPNGASKNGALSKTRAGHLGNEADKQTNGSSRKKSNKSKQSARHPSPPQGSGASEEACQKKRQNGSGAESTPARAHDNMSLASDHAPSATARSASPPSNKPASSPPPPLTPASEGSAAPAQRLWSRVLVGSSPPEHVRKPKVAPTTMPGDAKSEGDWPSLGSRPPQRGRRGQGKGA